MIRGLLASCWWVALVAELVPGVARLVLQPGVRLLRPEEQLFEAMTEGWRRQQLARHLAFGTIDARVRMVSRFQAFTNSYPWQWSPSDFEEWVEELRSRGQARSSLRTLGWAVRTFLGYVCDPVYGWAEECTERFGTHPVQICTRWNTIAHVVGSEGRPTRRALTRQELQDLFDAADDDVARARRLGRKGWLSLFRDATLFKVAYAWGLRREEVRRLEVCDFGVNPKASEFGAYGACYVRFAKGAHGSGPRRRTVLTVMPWSVDIVAEWVERVRWEYQPGVNQSLWPSERSPLVSEHQLNARFADLRDRIGLAPGMGMHCLRHSYVTHLIEDGWDALFVQHQVGHEYASTTAVYTSVSSDYRTTAVRAALDRIAGTAVASPGERA
jgi:site-specific recombinase XerD